MNLSEETPQLRKWILRILLEDSRKPFIHGDEKFIFVWQGRYEYRIHVYTHNVHGRTEEFMDVPEPLTVRSFIEANNRRIITKIHES